jgi:hypothetical protein
VRQGCKGERLPARRVAPAGEHDHKAEGCRRRLVRVRVRVWARVWVRVRVEVGVRVGVRVRVSRLRAREQSQHVLRHRVDDAIDKGGVDLEVTHAGSERIRE